MTPSWRASESAIAPVPSGELSSTIRMRCRPGASFRARRASAADDPLDRRALRCRSGSRPRRLLHGSERVVDQLRPRTRADLQDIGRRRGMWARRPVEDAPCHGRRVPWLRSPAELGRAGTARTSAPPPSPACGRAPGCRAALDRGHGLRQRAGSRGHSQAPATAHRVLRSARDDQRQAGIVRGAASGADESRDHEHARVHAVRAARGHPASRWR